MIVPVLLLLPLLAKAELLSKLLEAPFSCDRCWKDSPAQPAQGSTDWCLCCFYNCGGNRAGCFRDGLCSTGARCANLDICDRYGGVPPDGALPGVVSSFFEKDGKTLKESAAGLLHKKVVSPILGKLGDLLSPHKKDDYEREKCDSERWKCKGNACGCVRAKCKKVEKDDGGSGHRGLAEFFSDWPCSKDKECPCVCADDLKQRCEDLGGQDTDEDSPPQHEQYCKKASDCSEADPKHRCDWHCQNGKCKKGADNDTLCTGCKADECRTHQCVEGECEFKFKNATTPCKEKNCPNGQCDGNGHCVCVTTTPKPPTTIPTTPVPTTPVPTTPAPPTPVPTTPVPSTPVPTTPVPTPQLGACCTLSGCVQTSQTNCGVLEGYFAGVGTSCDDQCGLGCCKIADCGAVPDQCYADINIAQCAQLKFDNDCDSSILSSGSCCDFCIDLPPPNNACLALGACCSSGTCTTSLEENCNGYFFGEGTVCSSYPENVCSEGCCLGPNPFDDNEPHCTPNALRSDCPNFPNGTPSTHTPGESCCENPICEGVPIDQDCPSDGACCTTANVCDTRPESQCNGYFYGSGSTCAELPENTCDAGCCYGPNAQGQPTCTPDVLRAECADFPEGSPYTGFHHAGETCCGSFECATRPASNTTVCPENGACCLGNNVCVVTSSDACTANRGAFSGAGSECGPEYTCPTIACCLADGCQQLTAQQCGQAQGINVGSTCTPNICSGACCLRSGDCTVTLASICDASGGVSNEIGSTCAGLRCGPGCCVGESNCTQDVNYATCYFSEGVTDFLPGESCCANGACASKNVTPPCCETERRCGERAGCYGGSKDGLICRTLADCPGAKKCIPISKSCRNDEVCQDCDDNDDDLRAHKCGACEFCEPDDEDDEEAFGVGKRRHRNKSRSPLGLPCCPYEDEHEPSSTVINLKNSPFRRRCGGGNGNETVDDDCRPRLGCSCQNCADDCDIKLHGYEHDQKPRLLGYEYNGYTSSALPGLNVMTCSPLVNPEIDSDFCEDLVDSACHLRPESPIGATIDPHAILTQPELCTDRQVFTPKKHDIYAIYAVEREVKISIVERAADEEDFSPIVGDLVYLIDASDKCKDARTISPSSIVVSSSVDSHSDLFERTVTFKFLVPKQGDYLVVYSLYEFNYNADDSPVTEQQRLALRCKRYQIGVSYCAPQCPAELCDVHKFCFGPRDCSNGTVSCYACATQFGRCIVSAPFNDRFAQDYSRRFENELPSTKYADELDDDDDHHDVAWHKTHASRKDKKGKDDKKPSDRVPICAGVACGVPCIGVKQNGKQRVCVIGKCPGDNRRGGFGEDNDRSECYCDLEGGLEFDCDCECPRLCFSDRDCSDGNPRTIDKCTEQGVCVSRPVLVIPTPPPPPPPTPTIGFACNDVTNVVTEIVVNCTTDTLEFPGECGIPTDENATDISCFSVVFANSTSEEPVRTIANCTTVFNNCTADGAGTCTCLGVNQTLCERTVSGSDDIFVFICTEFNITESNETAPSLFSSVGRITLSPLDSKCARSALDVAEIAYTASAFDVFGTYDPSSGERLPPICGIDVEQSEIEVSIEKHAGALAPCCHDRVSLEQTCLDGASSEIALGHKWFDRAWLALDSASRAAQAQSTLESLEQACCASLYYAAMGDWCGRRGPDIDYWQLSTASVQRSEIGAECAAFDDGHRDRDLNDWVVEQRVAEVVRVDGSLAAINVHVLPLARGGGYQASYAISVRGSKIESIDRGATAACSERARAVLRETYDANAITESLQSRNALPEGTFVGVMRHSTVDSELPVGVRDSDCATLAGSGQNLPYCPLQESGTVSLFADVRRTLPPSTPDALDALLGNGARIQRWTNTKAGTRTVRPLFSASAVIVPPARTYAGVSDSVRFVLQNEDCGSAVLLPTATEQPHPSPLAVRVPAHSCPAFRWAAEGVALVQNTRLAERTCRGGSEGGIAECSVGAEGVCTQTGGECASAPSVEGVPYANAFAHFACERCASESECSELDECRGHACCQEKVLHWYRYPNAALVFQPRQVDQALLEQLVQSSKQSNE